MSNAAGAAPGSPGIVLPVTSRPPLPRTVYAPAVQRPPARPAAASPRRRRPWWMPTVREAAVGLLYVACGFVMVLVLTAMLAG